MTAGTCPYCGHKVANDGCTCLRKDNQIPPYQGAQPHLK